MYFISVVILAQSCYHKIVVAVMLSPVLLSETRCIGIAGVKAKWKISNPEDYVSVDGSVFVRVAGTSYTLMSIVCPEHSKQASMASSKGLSQLIAIRNQTQAVHMSETAGDGMCSLFDKPKKKHAKRTPRHEAENLRATPQIMGISVDVGGRTHNIEVLRPVHSTDNLFVAYKAEALTPLMHYLREAGFEEPREHKTKQFPKGTKGVHVRKNCLVVKFKKRDGANGYKTVKTLDEAVAFKAEPVQHDDDDDESVCDAGDDENAGGDDEVDDENAGPP